MRVLLIEDAKRLADAVAQVLRRNHYSVDVCFDGQSGLEHALSGIYDVILLDIMLPEREGLSVLAELRAQRVATPVLLLTAKGQTEDKIAGLDAGADDYLAKPFDMNELLARLRALGRRRGDALPCDCLIVGDIELNPHTLELRSATHCCSLTLKEAQLLELLIRNCGITLAPQTIIERVWGYGSDAEDRHVQVYISFLRKKLALVKSSVGIRTVRGLGYLLESREGH
ncbi:MAG: response regulator transcription factor [Coriobacteriales bacterium]|jgi:DNA-binding response OmpR family regulator|nr:response regulator transcription factor [Coriobacteriales bacterium]